MSLINDALRKARQEAAEREAEEKGVAYRPPRAHLPERSGMGMGLVLGLVFGFLGAFAGAYLLLRPSAPSVPETAAAEPVELATTAELAAPSAVPAGTESASEGTKEKATETDPSTPESAAGATSEEIEAAEAIGSAAPVVDESPSPESPPPPTAAAASAPPAAPEAPVRRSNEDEPSPVADEPEAPSAVETASAPAEEPASEAGDSPPRIRPPERVGQVDDTNEFVLEADLGDVRLTLDFIVWIPGRPFAQINGRQVEEGQLVEELLVEKIERERVTLRGANGRLVLRVR